MNSLEKIKEELLVSSEERAEELRLYLEEEEARMKAERLLDQRLRDQADRGLNFAI